jgi:hypothetical protein
MAHQFDGVVQDRSASGETAFIEPLFAVELNNHLLMASKEEEWLVRRILGDLTALVHAEHETRQPQQRRPHDHEPERHAELSRVPVPLAVVDHGDLPHWNSCPGWRVVRTAFEPGRRLSLPCAQLWGLRAAAGLYLLVPRQRQQATDVSPVP